MKITKIVAISAFGILLGACNANQMQKEAPAASASTASAAPSENPPHVHSVQGHGDLNHSHPGNSTPSHGHSWEQIQSELKK